MSMPPLRFAIVGLGRAGGSFRSALTSVGADCSDVVARGDDPGRLDPTLDLVLLTVPDRAIAEIAARVPAGPLVAHVSGATTLAPLRAHHERCGSIHPLMSLPNETAGAVALLNQANLAIAGADDDCERELMAIAGQLGANPFVVDEEHRAQYHAAASIAANHLVALVAQVERITTGAELPLAPFLDMMRGVIDNIEGSDAVGALTGPAARADWGTIAAHIEALSPVERELYVTMSKACADLAGHDFPFAVPTTLHEEQL